MLTALFYFLCYVIVGAVTGSTVDVIKNSKKYSRWDSGDSFVLGAGWPITLFWYGFIKPIANLTMRIVQWQIERRRLLEEEKEEYRLRFEEAKLEVEKILSRREDYLPEQHEEEVRPVLHRRPRPGSGV